LTAVQLFNWNKAYLEGSLVAVGTNETLVPASELQEVFRRIKQLEVAPRRNTLVNEIYKEAVDFAKAKSGLRTSLYCPRTSSKSFVPRNGSIAKQLIDQITRSSE
jgi:transposase